MKQNKLNYCLLGLSALFCIGAAQGATVRCDPVKVTGYTQAKAGGVTPGSTYDIYVKFKYTAGSASKTTELKIIRNRFPNNQVIQKFNSFNTLDIVDGSPNIIGGEKDGDTIHMARTAGNTWNVTTSFAFQRVTKFNTVYGAYDGTMTCAGEEDGKEGDD